MSVIALLRAWLLRVCRWAYTCWETRDVLFHGRVPPDVAIHRYTDFLRAQQAPLASVSSLVRGAHDLAPGPLPFTVTGNDGEPKPLYTCGFCFLQIAGDVCECGARRRALDGSALVLWERASR
jgi:hypothetical protein